MNARSLSLLKLEYIREIGQVYGGFTLLMLLLDHVIIRPGCNPSAILNTVMSSRATLKYVLTLPVHQIACERSMVNS